MNKEIRVVSLFAGVGGFEDGFKLSSLNHKFIFTSEIDKSAITTYSYNYSLENMHGDIKAISEKDIPDHDMLIGGFPCQTFSLAGKQDGFKDIRGTLFFDIIRILKEKQPRYILLENVKNLISHDGSDTIKTILTNISNCGYTFDISIINSSEAGVPQSRERTYIVGILNYKTDSFNLDKRNSKINSIKKWANENNLLTMNFFNNVEYNNPKKYMHDILNKNVDSKYYLNNDKVDHYLNKTNCEIPNISKVHKISKILDLPKEVHNDLDRQRRVYSIKGIAPTILARSDSPKILLNENNTYKIRKLTPIETFKAQGFSSGFIKNVENNLMSDTQLYKQAGNAVSPPVITGIINELNKYIQNETNNYKFIDLFCGLGGFRLALEKQNAKCVFSSDIDSEVRKTYENNFGETPSGDITKIESSDIPDFDILCGGFPCQSFSIAGKRLGFEDARGTMFFEISRILKEKQPKAFIIENVKGITNHNKGETLKTILNILDDLNYNFVYKVINAAEYGIPQSRERWYCVGVKKDLNITLTEEIFPIKKELLFDYDNIIDKNLCDEKYNISKICKKNIDSFKIKIPTDKIHYALAYEIRPSRCQFRTNGIAPCLTAKMGTGGNNVPVIVELNRKLTENECLKLMGYPDNYKIGKGSQAYKQIGNSVIVPILETIAKNLINTLKKNETNL